MMTYLHAARVLHQFLGVFGQLPDVGSPLRLCLPVLMTAPGASCRDPVR